MRIASRPGWIGILFLTKLALGWLIASPLLLRLGQSPLLQGPRGDAALFNPGGLMLVELVWGDRSALLGAAKTTALLFGAAWLMLALMAVPTLVAFSRRGTLSSLRFVHQCALRVGPLLALSAASLGATLSIGLLYRFFQRGLAGTLYTLFGERGSDLAQLLLLLFGVLCLAGLGLWMDLSRAAVVTRELGPRAALRVGWARLGRRPLGLALAAGGRLAIALGALVAVQIGSFHLLRGGTGSWLLALGPNLLAALIALLLRLDWLCVTLRETSTN